MLKLFSAAMLLVAAAAAFAQAQPDRTTPSVAPTQTPAVTPSQTPSVTPSTGAPIVGTTPPAPVVEQRQLGGVSRCENMLAFERDKCLQDESSAAGGATRAPAPAGVTTPQNPAPTSQNPAAPAAGTTTPQR